MDKVYQLVAHCLCQQFNCKKCGLAAASDKVYQLIAHGQWFSLGTLTSSTTKASHHDIAESGAKHQIKIKSDLKVYTLSIHMNY